MISYLNPASSLTAAHWNDIFAAADAALIDSLGGLSAVLAGLDSQFDRGFFFFDPLNVSPALLHPMAATFVTSQYWANAATASHGTQPAMYLRQYADIPGAFIAGLSTVATSVPFGVVQLSKPTWTSWLAMAYPSGFGGYSTNQMYDAGTGLVADNALDVSLAVVKSGGYAVTFKDATTAEHAKPLTPIDVFIIGNSTWLSAWDKYSLIRVHNCGRANATVLATTIKPGASQCFRKTGSSWSANGQYLHWMAAGDGRFLQMRQRTTGACSLQQPGIAGDLLAEVLAGWGGSTWSDFGRYFDPSKFWDISGIYNNSAYTPSSLDNERTPPSGGYLPAVSLSAALGDLLVHRGKVVVRQSGSTINLMDFTGFASLATQLTAAGVSSRTATTGHGTTMEIYSAGNYALIDASSPLISFLINGPSAVIAGASQSSSPPSLLLPWMLLAALDVQPTTSTTVDNWSAWSLVGGVPTLGAPQSVTISNHHASVTLRSAIYQLTDTPNTMVTQLVNWANFGGLITVQNAVVLSTVHGPVLCWDELWNLDARFTIANLSTARLGINTAKVVLDAIHRRLVVTRAVFLADILTTDAFTQRTSGIWPPRGPASSMVRWNYPRIDQSYCWQRFFYHDPAAAPMMPDWSSYFGGSHYASVAFKIAPGQYSFYNDGFGGYGGTAGDLESAQFNTVATFYETAPISVDTPRLPSTIAYKTGIARLGPWLPGTDAWGPFSVWLNSGYTGTFYWGIAPDLTGATNSISLGAAHWTNIFNGLTSNTPADVDQVSPNLLTCQAEHFNSIAGLVNAQPPARMKYAPGTGTTFTLDMSAGNITVLSPGTGFTAGQSIAYGLKVGTVDGSGGIVTVLQDTAAVTLTCDAYNTTLRPFDIGGGALIDTTVGDGSQLSFVPTFGDGGYGPWPVSVPLPTSLNATTVYSATSFWPKNAFFTWYGPGLGCADPLGDYLASLGVTVQTTLPDSYGTVTLGQYGSFNADMSGGAFTGGMTYETDPAYQLYSAGIPMPVPTPPIQGMDFVWAARCKAYRWMSFDSAKALYAAFSLPFSVNVVAAPMSWHIVTASQTRYSQVVTPFGGVQDVPSGSPAPSPYYGVGTGFTYLYWLTPVVVATDVMLLNAGDFLSDASGNWLCNSGLQTLSASAFPKQWGAPQGMYAEIIYTHFTFDHTDTSVTPNVDVYNAIGDVTDYFSRFDWGVLNPVMWGVTNAPLQALAYILIGQPAQVVAALPQNYAYQDPAWTPTLDQGIKALGTSIVPYDLDNGVESSPAELTQIAAYGESLGTPIYITVVTTSLANARLVLVPTD